MTTVVIGGGMAGALAARALDESGVDVVVVDAGSEPGGIARPVHRDGYHLEPAVGTLQLPHPALSPLLHGLDIDLVPTAAAARRRFVRHRNRTIALRPGPGLIVSPIVSPLGKLRAAAEPFVGRPPAVGEESLEAFLVRRLGGEAGRLAAWLMAVGVHAGDPGSLSAEATFPALTHLEREHGSLLRGLAARRGEMGERPSSHIVSGGTAKVAEAVARSLGERWRRSWQAERLERTTHGWRVHGPEVIEADRVIAAVRPETLGRIFPSVAPDPVATTSAPVAVVWLGLAGPVLPEGFGTLIGPGEGFTTLGFLYESAYAPHRAPTGRGLVKAIVGGSPHPDSPALPDADLVERAAEELSRVLGAAPDVVMSHVIRHEPGIPQYTASRRRMVDRLRVSLPPGLEVSGWAYDGVGISHLATAAVRLAAADSVRGSRASG